MFSADGAIPIAVIITKLLIKLADNIPDPFAFGVFLFCVIYWLFVDLHYSTFSSPFSLIFVCSTWKCPIKWASQLFLDGCHFNFIVQSVLTQLFCFILNYHNPTKQFTFPEIVALLVFQRDRVNRVNICTLTPVSTITIYDILPHTIKIRK